MHHRLWGRVGLGREIRDPEGACILSARETWKGNVGTETHRTGSEPGA